MSKLYVVGIGPGEPDGMTVRADRVLRQCQVLVGYHVYVDLVRDTYPDKEFLSTPMTQEVDRCRMALECAKSGRDTAVICSGDSGVYGMAGLLYELRGENPEPELEVIPGVTAACAGGAILGAPLSGDFAAISLSDRLTDWDEIRKRLTAAAEADLVLAIYNPASKGRPEHLRRACEILLRILPPDRPCGVARDIGRARELASVCTLAQLCDCPADMFCTVFIGNSRTRIIAGKLVTSRGYKNV